MDISIIVPLYKGEKYIPHIIDMVRENQKILIKNGLIIDIEIIFVNDCPFETINFRGIPWSVDVSIQLYENRENFGIYRTRLNGLKHAKGTYILFLDQDDEISSFYLWRQLKYIGKADAVLCNGIYRRNKIIYKSLEQQQSAICKDEYISKGTNIVSPGQVLMKRASIPNRWLNLTLKENGSDDVLLWTLMLCEGEKININPVIDYIHVENGKNASLDFINMKESINEMLKIVKTKKILENNDLKLFESACLKRINKCEHYITILEHWKEILEKINNLTNIEGYQKFAIYGNGIIGKKLLHDLEKLDIKPEFVIDSAAENFAESSYKVYGINNMPQNVDLIILTPLFDKEKIIQDLNGIKSRIICLDELIGKMLEVKSLLNIVP